MEGALADLEACALGEGDKALLRFVVKVNGEAHAIAAADIAAVTAAGWTDEAVYDAIMVCALFNFYNRWIDANGVGGCPDSVYRETGIRMARGGYSREGT